MSYKQTVRYVHCLSKGVGAAAQSKKKGGRMAERGHSEDGEVSSRRLKEVRTIHYVAFVH